MVLALPVRQRDKMLERGYEVNCNLGNEWRKALGRGVDLNPTTSTARTYVSGLSDLGRDGVLRVSKAIRSGRRKRAENKRKKRLANG